MQLNIEVVRTELAKLRIEDQFDSYSIEGANRRSKYLKTVIDKFGWPSSELFDEQSELTAFLIVQHSNNIAFQEYCLDLIKKLPMNSWQRKESIAYLTDRILVNTKQKQLYGTQFQNGEPFPIENLKNLDKRRKEMNLEPFEEYRKYFEKRKSQKSISRMRPDSV